MKKPKVNLTKQGIQDFLFRHVEKLIFGMTCALVLFFVWFGFKTPAYDGTTPDKMMDMTKQANQYINGSHWSTLSEHRVADTNAAERIREAPAVDPNTYEFNQIFGTAIYRLDPRRDPAFVAAKNFELQHIRAQIAMKEDPNSDSARPSAGGIGNLPESEIGLVMPVDQRGEMFAYRPDKHLSNKNRLLTRDVVVGTAIVDVTQQIKNYRENFQFQRGYDTIRDIPEYAAIEVERRTEDSEWVPITYHVYTNRGLLANPAKDLADPKYLDETLTMPIPPILSYDYRNISVVEGIPSAKIEGSGAKDGSDTKDEGSDTKDEGSDTKDVFDDNSLGEEGSDNKSEGPEKVAADEEVDGLAPKLLVRFFDLYAKEVGQTYYYRVRVWLKDPNNPTAVNVVVKEKSGGVEGPDIGGGGDGPADADGGSGGGGGGGGGGVAKVKKPLSELDLSREVRDRLRTPPEAPADVVAASNKNNNAAAGAKEFATLFAIARPTEWVETTQPIKINAEFETFVAGPVDAPSSQKIDGGRLTVGEHSIKVVANTFQNDLNTNVPAETEALRGSLLNFNAVTHLLDPLTWEIREVFESKNARDEKQGRRFETNAVILDIMGGSRQPFSKNRDVFFAPGECLIMDRNGNIHFHNDIEDETRYRHANFISEVNQGLIQDAEDEKRGRGRDDDNDEGDELGN